jgi:hypothetical protein
MKKILVICLVLTNWAQAQWKTMQRFEEFGIGNFYLFTDREVDAKRLISETFNFNAMKLSLDFQKGANLLLNVAVVDPQNSEFVYVVHCIRGVRDEVPGYHIFCYYMENRYRYFYDVSESGGRLSVIYDPGILDVSPNGTKKKN